MGYGQLITSHFTPAGCFNILSYRQGRVPAGQPSGIIGMSIRLIAKELYAFERQVDALKRRIASAPEEQKEELKDRLRKVTAERNRMRRVLDGAKDTPTF